MTEARPIGRDELIDTVLGHLAAGRSTVVLGPPGAGLSTVLRAVAHQLAAGGVPADLVRPPGAGGERGQDDARPDPVTADRRPSRSGGDQNRGQVGLGAPVGGVLVVDDAEGTSAAEIGRLCDLALSGPVLLGVRTGAAPNTLAWLWRSGAVERIELADLDEATMRRVVEQRAGAPLHRSTRDAVVHRAGGRPGFAVDEIDSLLTDGRLQVEGTSRRGRSTGRVGARSIERAVDVLASLPADLAEAVAVVATAGRLPHGAAAALDLDVPALVARALLAESAATWALVPPGLAVAVRASVAPRRAVDVGRRVLEATAATLAAEDRGRLLVLTGAPAALSDLSAAARAALRDDDRDEALRLAGLAAAHGPAGATVEAGLLADIGARAEAAERYLTLMVDESVPGDQRARAAMERSLILMWDLGRPAEAVDTAALLAAALRGTPFGAAAEVHLAALTMYAGRPSEALRTAAAIDERGDRAVAAARTLVSTVAEALVDPANADHRAVEALIGEPVAGAAERGVFVAATELSLELQGHYAAAGTAIAAARAARPASDTTSSGAWSALAEARGELAVGRIQRARRAATESAAAFADVNHPSGVRWATGAALLAAAQAGDRDTTRRTADTFDALDAGAPFLDADLLRARAWAAHLLGNSARAAELLRAAADTAAASEAVTLEAVALHDAFRLLRAPVRTRLVALGRRAPVPAITLRARHVQLATAGDPSALLALVPELEDAGALLLAAEAAADAARLAVSRDLRTVARAAVAQRARLSAMCEEPRTPALADHRPVRLTAREQDVVSLAADGRTSREIAAELSVSVRTVENQLQRVYVKLGVHGRTELATRLAAEGYAGGSTPR